MGLLYIVCGSFRGAPDATRAPLVTLSLCVEMSDDDELETLRQARRAALGESGNAQLEALRRRAAGTRPADTSYFADEPQRPSSRHIDEDEDDEACARHTQPVLRDSAAARRTNTHTALQCTGCLRGQIVNSVWPPIAPFNLTSLSVHPRRLQWCLHPHPSVTWTQTCARTSLSPLARK